MSIFSTHQLTICTALAHTPINNMYIFTTHQLTICFSTHQLTIVQLWHTPINNMYSFSTHQLTISTALLHTN